MNPQLAARKKSHAKINLKSRNYKASIWHEEKKQFLAAPSDVMENQHVDGSTDYDMIVPIDFEPMRPNVIKIEKISEEDK